MPWSDHAGPTPDRTEHELLALARSKADGIRRRRVQASASVAALAGVALLVLAGGALAGNGAGGPTKLQVVGPTPTSSGAAVAAATSTTLSPDATSTTQPAPSTTVRTVPATTTLATAPPTTAPPAPTTTVPWPTTSTSAPAGPTSCSPSEVLFLVTTDKSAYAPGETVKVSASVQNRSGHACARPNGSRVGFQNAAGAPVGISIGSHGDYVAGSGPSPWAPGETIVVINPQLGVWDQKSYDGGGMAQVPGGTYTVVASEGDFSGQASFTIG